MVGDQILVDDEWHGIGVSSWNTFGNIFSRFWGTGSVIPYNLYRKAALLTVGWSESILRFPAIIAGFLSLIIFPVFVRKLFDKKTVLVFLTLFAISPFLIFYSRFSRPYSIVVLLFFSALMFLYYWLTTSKRKYMWLYITSAVLSVYFLPLTIFAVTVPLFAGLIIKDRAAPDKNEVYVYPAKKEIFFTSITFFCVISALLLSPLINSYSEIKGKIGAGTFSLNIVFDSLKLISGTSNSFLTIVFLCFVLSGIFVVFKKNKLWGILSGTSVLSNFVFIGIFQPDFIQVPIVLTRYNIYLIPIIFIMFSAGVCGMFDIFRQTLFKIRPGINNFILSFAYSTVAVIFLLLLFKSGPLLSIYRYPNNFTNHSAFQESYEAFSVEKPYKSGFYDVFTVDENSVHNFYKKIGSEKDTYKIIEYPMIIADHLNPFYYYQFFHKKGVIIGYFSNSSFVGRCLNAPETKDNLHFKNMVDLSNIRDITASNAKYIILHKNVLNEAAATHNSDFNGYVDTLKEKYVKVFGPPIVEDQSIIVFGI